MNDRIYQGEDELWYFRVRGNQSVGPFDNFGDAQAKLNKQMKSWTGRSGPVAALPRNWQPARIFRRSATRQT